MFHKILGSQCPILYGRSMPLLQIRSFRVIPRTAVAFLAFLAAGAVLAGCSDDKADSSSATPSTTTTARAGRATASGLSMEVTHGGLRAGEQATWNLAVTNNGAQPATLTFPSSQRGEVVLKRDGAEIYRYSGQRVFSPALSNETIQPGTSQTFTLEDLLDVEPGKYEMTVSLSGTPDPGPVSVTVKID